MPPPVSAPALGSTNSAAGCPALFVGFKATMARSDFSRSCIIGYGSSPSRCGPTQHAYSRSWSAVRPPGSRARSVRTCQVLRPRRAGWALALACPSVLSSNRVKGVGTRDEVCDPLSTLRRRPRGRLRMTRGRCGSLLLHRGGLAPPTTCRSPGALTQDPKRSCCCVWRLTILNSQRGAGSKPCDLNNAIAAGDVSKFNRVCAASGCFAAVPILPVKTM
jgi:hypothetical protein